MFRKILSILFSLIFMVTACASFFLADAHNETEVPTHTHTEVSHGWAACIPTPWPSISGGAPGSGCFSITQCFGLYSVTLTECTHGIAGGVGCSAIDRSGKTPLCADNGDCDGNQRCSYSGCYCNTSWGSNTSS